MINSFKIPAKWKIAALSDIAEVIMGQSPPSITYNIDKEGLPFYQGKADFGELFPSPKVWCSKPKKIALKGDILISVRAPVGPTNICQETSCIGRGLAAIRTKEFIERDFLFYWLRNIENEIRDLSTGTTFGAIRGSQLRSIIVPVPKISEQRDIIEKLERFHSMISSVDEALNKTMIRIETNHKSLLNRFFGSVNTSYSETHIQSENTHNLLSVKIGSLRPKFNHTINPSKSPDEYFEVYSVPSFDSGQPEIIKGKDIGSNKILVEPENVLLCKINPKINRVWKVGKFSEYRKLASTEWVVISPRAGISADYLKYYFSQPTFRNFLFMNVSGVGGSLTRARKEPIYESSILLPSFEEQLKLVSKFEGVASANQIARMEINDNLSKAEILWKSILIKSFQGTLIKMNSSSESESKILDFVNISKGNRGYKDTVNQTRLF